MENSRDTRFYMIERDIEFTCVEENALKSCHLSVNMCRLTFRST